MINTETNKPKEYFEAEIYFAYTISNIKKISMSEAAKNFTGVAREITGMMKEDWEEVKNSKLWIDLKFKLDTLTNPEDITNLVFNMYKHQSHSKYNPDDDHGYKRFGSLAYDYFEDIKTVRIHFLPERSTISALSSRFIEDRKNDFKALLEDVKSNYPEAEFVKSSTWLQNLPNYKKLFPLNFQNDLEDIGASSYIGIWGQFQKGDGYGNTERLGEFKKKLSHAKTLEEAIDSFPLKVLEVTGSIEEFYKYYEIKQ